MATDVVELDCAEVMKQCKLSIRVTGVDKARFRIWVASQLIILAGWIAGTSPIHVEWE